MKRITIGLALVALVQTEDLYAEASFLDDGAVLLAPEFQADGGWETVCDGDHVGQRKAPVASKRMAGAVGAAPARQQTPHRQVEQGV